MAYFGYYSQNKLSYKWEKRIKDAVVTHKDRTNPKGSGSTSSSALIDFNSSATEAACFEADKACLARESALDCRPTAGLSESIVTGCRVEDAAISPVGEEVNLQ